MTLPAQGETTMYVTFQQIKKSLHFQREPEWMVAVVGCICMYSEQGVDRCFVSKSKMRLIKKES